MSRAHEVRTAANWTTVSLREPLRREAEPYGAQAEILRVEGAELDLPPEQALNLGLAIHEMMTDAAKHGALSAAGGTITVRVSCGPAEPGAEPASRVEWVEAGGPEVSAPTGSGGFGTLLLGGILGPGVGGRVEIDPQTEGMRCVIEFQRGGRDPIPRAIAFGPRLLGRRPRGTASVAPGGGAPRRGSGGQGGLGRWSTRSRRERRDGA